MFTNTQSIILLNLATQFSKNTPDPEECSSYIISLITPKIDENTSPQLINSMCRFARLNFIRADTRRENHLIRDLFSMVDDPEQNDNEYFSASDGTNPEEIIIEREEENLIAQLFHTANLTPAEKNLFYYRAQGNLTLQKYAEVEHISKNEAKKINFRARAKLRPLLTEIAIAEGFNPSGKYTAKHGNATSSHHKYPDEYHPRHKATGKA